MDKCTICGAPVENGKCSYCGAIATQPAAVPGIQQPNGPVQPIYIINGQQPPPIVIHQQNGPVPSPKSKVVAALLCFFLGFFGAHQFYVGKAGMGIVYFFTGGLLGIGMIVDLIRILTNSFKDSHGLILKN